MAEERNAEARFASPEDSNVGIGYFDESGTELSPEAFRKRVAEDAARIEAEEASGGPGESES